MRRSGYLLLLAVLAAPAVARAQNITEYNVPATRYSSGRKVFVYLPVGYPQACSGGCSLLLSFDADVYTTSMRLPQILDSLIASKSIRPAIALIVDNSADRVRDLGNGSTFAAFLVDELIPWAHAKWNITRDPSRVTVTGSSAGGLAAAYVAFKRPDVVGNVFSQSGALWRGNEGTNSAPFEWLTAQYRNAPHKPIRFILEVGSTETHGALGGAAPSILAANRALRDVLTSKGYDVS